MRTMIEKVACDYCSRDITSNAKVVALVIDDIGYSLDLCRTCHKEVKAIVADLVASVAPVPARDSVPPSDEPRSQQIANALEAYCPVHQQSFKNAAGLAVHNARMHGDS